MLDPRGREEGSVAMAVIWPAFHLNQVALGAAGITEFSFLAPHISAAVLAAITVLFGGLAIRRLARKSSES